MKRPYLFYIVMVLSFGISLMPDIAMAFSLSFLSFDSPDSDKSIFYLGQIFGPVGTALPKGTGNALLSNLFSIFNIAVLTLGSIVVSYTIILSTINTAQEGEVMGRKWSSLWIPIRSSVGVAFLIPTASGYSLLQIMMMSIIVYGIGAANQLWAVVVNAFSGSGSGFSGKITATNVGSAASNSLTNGICQYVLNNNPACRTAIGTNNVVSFYQDPVNSNRFYWGVQGNPGLAQICGSATSGNPKPAQVLDQASWNASNYLAIDMGINSFGPAISEMVSGQLPTKANIIPTAKSVIQGNLASAPQAPTNLSGTNLEALENGWLFAGSYYIAMISNGNTDLSYPAPNVTTASSQQLAGLGTNCNAALNAAYSNQTNYLAQSEVTASTALASYSLIIPPVSSASEISSIMDAIAGPLQGAVTTFLQTLTTNDPRGPVPSMAKIGTNILNLAENIWVGVMLAGLIALLFGCLMSGTNPLCWAIGIVLGIVVPVLNIIIGLLWGVGGILGIYLPLVPYIIFTFTALGWMLLVIETIVAAPIVALGLVSPAGEHLGKATPAVLLIVNVFLRPSLMIIGFVLGAKLVDAVITMLNYGFFATVNASISGLGIFGTIALITLYGGTAIALVQECFTLIYILPDKIIRWLGGQAEQSNVKQNLQEAKKNIDKGSDIGAGIVKGSAGFMNEKFGSEGKGIEELSNKMSKKKKKKKEEDDEPEDDEGEEPEEGEGAEDGDVQVGESGSGGGGGGGAGGGGAG